MIKYSLLVVALVAISGLKAQDPVFTWNPANTKPAMQVDVQILGHTSEGYYVVNKKPASGMEFSPTITVEYFNNKQDRVFTKDVTPAKTEDYVNMVYFNHSLHLVSSLYTKVTGRNVLSLIPVNRDGSMGKAVELASISAEKLSDRGRFDVAASPDGNKLVILSQPDYVKDANEKITIALYSGEYKKDWSSDQTYPYAWSKTVDNTPSVNNESVVFILKRVIVKGGDDFYSIFSFEGKSLKEYKNPVTEKNKIGTIVYALSPEGDFTAAGYYSEDKKFRAGIGTPFHGSFLQRIDHGGGSAKISVATPFEKRKDIKARNIVFDGGRTILLGEYAYVSERDKPRDPSKPTSIEDMFAKDYSYSGGDVIIDAFDESGKIIYNAKVDKSNSSQNDNGTWVSYFGAIIKGKLYIIFNDDKYKYDDKKKIIVINSPRIVAYTTVDPATGKVEEPKALLNTGPVGGKSGDMLLRPDVFLKIDDSHYIIRAENPKIYRMGLVNF